MSRRTFSEERLDRMGRILAGHVERGVPGLVALIRRDDELHVEAHGGIAVGGAPVGRDTIFRISSMSKPITAVAAMILVEECRLRLDDPVDRLLPELADRRVLKRLDGPLDETVPAGRAITLRDLLTFRMGFGQLMASPDDYPILRRSVDLGIGMGPPDPTSMPDPDEWLRRLGTLPLMSQPGEKWIYNTGADLLGVLIARASGQPFETFLRERIFEPLGMKDTGFHVPPGKIDRLATAYQADPVTGELGVLDPARDGKWSRPPAFPSGAAGMVSTADDYMAFATMMLRMGAYDGGRILSRPTVDVMTIDHLTPAQKAVSGLVPGQFDASGWGFGLGIATRRDDATSVPGSYGWDGGLGSAWFNDPVEHMAGVLLTQLLWSSPRPPEVCVDFRTAAYQAIDD